MEEKKQHPEQIVKDIRELMERSSRFVSLSGWSGIAAGSCALTGAYLASQKIGCAVIGNCLFSRLAAENSQLKTQLSVIAILTFAAALSTAFFFTWLRSTKTGVPLWGRTAKRLLWNLALPLAAGAVFLYQMIRLEQYELVAPGCLLFYGLALVNASKYTLSEIRYLGYAEMALAIINCWSPQDGIYFWAGGFGVLHIVYGALMWFRYERGEVSV